jgi:hypothetical protein
VGSKLGLPSAVRADGVPRRRPELAGDRRPGAWVWAELRVAWHLGSSTTSQGSLSPARSTLAVPSAARYAAAAPTPRSSSGELCPRPGVPTSPRRRLWGRGEFLQASSSVTGVFFTHGPVAGWHTAL